MIDTAKGEGGHAYWTIACGALIGAFAGYIVGTAKGRRLYGAAVQTLEDFSFECPRFCQAIVRADKAARDSWKVFSADRPVDGRSDLRDVVGK